MNEDILLKKLNNIEVEIATIKVDITWIKRLVLIAVIAVSALVGIDPTGLITS